MPYLLRDKVISFPNQVWSIDITCIKIHHSHMYLTAIIDWHSRYIVGWNLSDTLDTCYVTQAVKDAVAACGIPAILNSDQVSQFTSQEYKTLLKELHITQSMDGKSRWADNIMIERWFRSLKTEEIYLNEYDSPRALRKAISAYIRQYNALRPHEALDYLTHRRRCIIAALPHVPPTLTVWGWLVELLWRRGSADHGGTRGPSPLILYHPTPDCQGNPLRGRLPSSVPTGVEAQRTIQIIAIWKLLVHDKFSLFGLDRGTIIVPAWRIYVPFLVCLPPV